VRYPRSSLYLRERTLHVVLHNIYKKFANGAEVVSPDWSVLLEIWHESTAQLIADGVPQERVLPSGGAYHVLQIWNSNRRKVLMSKSLCRWAYDPAYDTHKQSCSDSVASGMVEDVLDKIGVEDMMVDERVESDEEGDDLSDNEDAPYHWPSDTNRFRVLASSAEITSIVATKENPSPADSAAGLAVNPTIQIGSKQPRAIAMGQHRVSTLRILVRFMRDIHNDVFHGETELGENDFWRHTWFRLNETWGNMSERTLKARFGWVLDYIRTGALPNEAQCVKDTLREIWMDAETILRTPKHPYGYYPGCANESCFNPDLCPRWTKAMMTQQNAMSTVRQRLHSSCGVQLTQDKIASCYGVLIADLWEEAYAEGCLDDNRGHQTSLGDTPKANHGTEIDDEVIPVNNDITITATGTSVKPKPLRGRKRPKDDVNAAEESAQKRSKHEIVESNGTNLDKKIQYGLDNLSRPRWTKEHNDWIISSYPHGQTDWGDMSRQFAVRFGVTRTPRAFKEQCIRNLNWKSFSDDWNFCQRMWLVKAAQQQTPWIQMVEPFNKKFKMQRTSEELKSHFDDMQRHFDPTTPENCKPRWARGSTNDKLRSKLFPSKQTSYRWTTEEEDWLCQRIVWKTNWTALAAESAVKFGTQRTAEALRGKVVEIRARDPQKINFQKKQKDRWTTQQHAWLMQEAAGRKATMIDWNATVSLFETRFGFQRSSGSLRSHYGQKHVEAALEDECEAEYAHS
jgi:hypothetical protein